MSVATEPEVLPWRFFAARVERLTRLSPSFLRVTFTGPDLRFFADNGYDQRIKLILPVPVHGLAHLPTGPDWHSRWRALPDEHRNPVRTYTVRAARPEAGEVDIDIVVHETVHNGGQLGPAARWALSVRVGDEAALLGPDGRHPGPHGGIDFRQPAPGVPILLAGDETTVPAIAAILSRLPEDTRGEVLLEVPHRGDALDLDAPSDVHITWLTREGVDHGSLLTPGVEAAVARLRPSRVAADASSAGHGAEALRDVDIDVVVDHEILWEVPEAAAVDDIYVWLAGESAVIRTLRGHLRGECGLDRRAVALMGYWRQGLAEN
jgi:NADPH-dependent ferric siderophore reductase